ncbi:hypothetical protein ACIOTI_31430 [Streptomyces sp. NPDC087843]|uniref:hypothetical protein n=1 Tax=Streptomyces sp. NPDC087843 TaxID=3365804 RepID=UPI00382CD49D
MTELLSEAEVGEPSGMYRYAAIPTVETMTAAVTEREALWRRMGGDFLIRMGKEGVALAMEGGSPAG